MSHGTQTHMNFNYFKGFFFICRMEAERLSRALGCRLLRTSVKEDVNVAAVFRHLTARCLDELREPPDSPEYTITAGGALPHARTISK